MAETSGTKASAVPEEQRRAQAEMRVEAKEVKSIFVRLFRRARALVAAYRDRAVQMSRDVVNAIRRGFRRFGNTTAGKLVLSGIGMIYTGQLAIGSGRYLAYSVGAGASYVFSQILAVGFVVFGAAWFLQFGSTFLSALGSNETSTITA